MVVGYRRATSLRARWGGAHVGADARRPLRARHLAAAWSRKSPNARISSSRRWRRARGGSDRLGHCRLREDRRGRVVAEAIAGTRVGREVKASSGTERVGRLEFAHCERQMRRLRGRRRTACCLCRPAARTTGPALLTFVRSERVRVVDVVDVVDAGFRSGVEHQSCADRSGLRIACASNRLVALHSSALASGPERARHQPRRWLPLAEPRLTPASSASSVAAVPAYGTPPTARAHRLIRMSISGGMTEPEPTPVKDRGHLQARTAN